MKILWVKPGKILPLDTGGKLRTYNILRHLCKTHEVTYISYYNGPRDEQYEQEVRLRLPGATPMHTAISKPSGMRRHLDYISKLASPIPYAVSCFAADRVKAIVGELISQRCFDVAVCDFLASSPNFPRDLATPTVLFQHNVESVLWRRRAQFETRWTHRLVSNIEAGKMRRYEARQLNRFHHVLAVSERDREEMSRIIDRSRISVVPTGVDLSTYRYDPGIQPNRSLVVFSGSMDWEPNVDAVEYFCEQIWPHVLREVPAARFRIVGRDPHPRVRKLASASVEITGTVPSMVEHFQQATVLVVPLRMGSGTRIKIYEGMAMGKAIVSTRVGAEGLDVHHEKDILLTDDPAGFAECVLSLLRNEGLRRSYEKAAAATARQYDWAVIAHKLAADLETIVCQSSRNEMLHTSVASA